MINFISPSNLMTIGSLIIIGVLIVTTRNFKGKQEKQVEYFLGVSLIIYITGLIISFLTYKELRIELQYFISTVIVLMQLAILIKIYLINKKG